MIHLHLSGTLSQRSASLFAGCQLEILLILVKYFVFAAVSELESTQLNGELAEM